MSYDTMIGFTVILTAIAGILGFHFITSVLTKGSYKLVFTFIFAGLIILFAVVNDKELSNASQRETNEVFSKVESGNLTINYSGRPSKDAITQLLKEKKVIITDIDFYERTVQLEKI